MDIGSVVNQSLIGMQNSRAEMTQSARQIAQATIATNPAATGSAAVDPASGGGPSTDLTTPLVNMQMQQHVFDSSARVFEVADQTIGALLDVKA